MSELPQTKEEWQKSVDDVVREVTLEEINGILSTTIKQDAESKLVTFLVMLLTYTEEDQQNIAFKSESCRGKSYIPLEIAEYFPSEDVKKTAYSSPTAFFHEKGEWDDENKLVNIDLKKKILVFLDQPHDQLMQRLRPLLSHDQKTLTYKITDRRQKSGYRTKTIVLNGFSTVIFCTAKISIEQQERTRMFLLSPQASQLKLEEAIELLSRRLGNRDEFKEWLQSHPERKWLMERIGTIKAAKVKNIIVPDIKEVCRRFLVYRENLIPRHQRDFPRLIALIKAHALLNCYQRNYDAKTLNITANAADVQAGFKLYEKIVVPQELGLSPEVLEIYEKVFRPNFQYDDENKKYLGISRRQLLIYYHEVFHRPLSQKRLVNEIIPLLESAFLIYEEPDPENKRQKMVFPEVSSLKNNIYPLTVGKHPEKPCMKVDTDSSILSYPHSRGIYSSSSEATEDSEKHKNSEWAKRATERTRKLREISEE